MQSLISSDGRTVPLPVKVDTLFERFGLTAAYGGQVLMGASGGNDETVRDLCGRLEVSQLRLLSGDQDVVAGFARDLQSLLIALRSAVVRDENGNGVRANLKGDALASALQLLIGIGKAYGWLGQGDGVEIALY
jgi:hypothetical protein